MEFKEFERNSAELPKKGKFERIERGAKGTIVLTFPNNPLRFGGSFFYFYFNYLIL